MCALSSEVQNALILRMQAVAEPYWVASANLYKRARKLLKSVPEDTHALYFLACMYSEGGWGHAEDLTKYAAIVSEHSHNAELLERTRMFNGNWGPGNSKIARDKMLAGDFTAYEANYNSGIDLPQDELAEALYDLCTVVGVLNRRSEQSRRTTVTTLRPFITMRNQTILIMHAMDSAQNLFETFHMLIAVCKRPDENVARFLINVHTNMNTCTFAPLLMYLLGWVATPVLGNLIQQTHEPINAVRVKSKYIKIRTLYRDRAYTWMLCAKRMRSQIVRDTAVIIGKLVYGARWWFWM
jgi:hypothetical protein